MFATTEVELALSTFWPMDQGHWQAQSSQVFTKRITIFWVNGWGGRWLELFCFSLVLVLIYFSESGGGVWVVSPCFLPFPGSLSSSILSTRVKIISDIEMKSAAKPHHVPVFLPSPLPAKPFSWADRKHFSLVTAPCHSDAACLASDMITECVRQAVFVWCWKALWWNPKAGMREAGQGWDIWEPGCFPLLCISCSAGWGSSNKPSWSCRILAHCSRSLKLQNSTWIWWFQ